MTTPSSTSTVNRKPIGYGLIGAGGFGRFAVENYRSLDSVKLLALADVNTQAARAAADDLGLEACDSIDALLAREDIELVHIATPPATHVELVTQALEAGKHVLCEKPLAINVDDAKRLAALAQQRDRVLSVDLIMRYDPLAEVVHAMIEQGLLGEVLHGFFENDAKDEPLPPDHWFWDKSKSGGIFIEHGVHFFDLFKWWLGEGRVASAQQVVRPGTENLVEQVLATMRYHQGGDSPTGGVLVSFYHGFTQATRMDRQELRLLFERGTVRLFEWVPTRIEIDALMTESQRDRIAALLHEPQIQTLATYTGEDRQVTSRGKNYVADGRYRITAGMGMDKPQLYGQVMRRLLADQIEAIHDRDHPRRVNDTDAVRSVEVAADAERLATR